MNPPTILVSHCYSEVTPESAEQGDFSDSGFIHEAEPFTFSELVHAIERGGFTQDGSTDWLSSGFSTIDYRTGTEREESLHFDRLNPERMEKWFWLAAEFVKRRQKARQQRTQLQSWEIKP